MRVRTIPADDGEAFTDRLFGPRRWAATGTHVSDGRIAEVLRGHHFRSGEYLEMPFAAMSGSTTGSAPVGTGRQDPAAGDEAPARTQARTVRREAICPTGMGQMDASGPIDDPADPVAVR